MGVTVRRMMFLNAKEVHNDLFDFRAEFQLILELRLVNVGVETTIWRLEL